MMALDLAIQDKLEWAIANQSEDSYLKQELATLKRLRFSCGYRFLTARKTFKMTYRSFRYDNEDQFELSDRQHLMARDKWVIPRK